MHWDATDDDAMKTDVAPYKAVVDLAAQVSPSPRQPARPPPRNPFQVADEESLRESIVVGSPDTCEASLRTLEEMGVGNVICFVNLGGLEPQRVVDSLQRFGREVLPRFMA